MEHSCESTSVSVRLAKLSVEEQSHPLSLNINHGHCSSSHRGLDPGYFKLANYCFECGGHLSGVLSCHGVESV